MLETRGQRAQALDLGVAAMWWGRGASLSERVQLPDALLSIVEVLSSF